MDRKPRHVHSVMQSMQFPVVREGGESITMKSANFARLFRPPEEGTESDSGIGIRMREE